MKLDRHKDRESEKRRTDIEKADRRTESTPKIWRYRDMKREEEKRRKERKKESNSNHIFTIPRKSAHLPFPIF